MKKLILIFTLLLLSLNLSANDTTRDMRNLNKYGDPYLSDTREVSREEIEKKQQSAQESFDRYKMFLEYNAQQEKDNPTGSRVSEDLLADAKVVAEVDLIEYAILETLRAAVDRDRFISTKDRIKGQDVVDGINAAREIIGPLTNNPVFSVEDQYRMSTVVNKYVREVHNEHADRNLGMLDDNDRYIFIAHELGGKPLVLRVISWTGGSPNQNLHDAARFTQNIASFFTNQNAVQSTCLGMSCAAPVGGM